jgi:hypothetical protein
MSDDRCPHCGESLSDTEQPSVRTPVVHLKDTSVFKQLPKPGDTVIYWSSKIENNVLETRPYTGRFPQYFTHFLKFKSDTPRGWSETVINVPSAREK